MKIFIVALGTLFVFVGYFILFPKGVTQVAEDTAPISSDFLSLGSEISALVSQEISAAEESGLLYMREEEKLARDVYITLYEKWSLPIFSNISQSEQTHTESVRAILVKYSIQDPVSDDTIGVFTNTELSKLYADLTTQGMVSAAEALAVGAIIEDLDISYLQEQIAMTDNEDIRLVYGNLMRGSRNHLRSFIAQLSSRDVIYKPQYITQKEFNSIISSPKETLK